jgi:hypothetical protein
LQKGMADSYAFLFHSGVGLYRRIMAYAALYYMFKDDLLLIMTC